jgi:hypothetical protein
MLRSSRRHEVIRLPQDAAKWYGCQKGNALNWARAQQEARLLRWGGETIDGRPLGLSEKPNGVGQACLTGPRSVARQDKRVRSTFLGKVRLALAGARLMPSLDGLPSSLVKEIVAAGGEGAWALGEPDTLKKIEKIRKRMPEKSSM